ncbi:MAG: D-alanine--D-alanine ligase family protein [Pseudonocardiaceae bacterium]
MTDRTVAVLAGGLSHERDVSLRSGRRLSSALRDAGLHVEQWDADANLISRLTSSRPDAAVIALHGDTGENGAVQSVLEMLRVPYVGADPRACRRAWDKPTAKDELARAGVSTPDWIALPHATFRDLGSQDVLDALVDRLGLPLILKPPQGGSALGVHIVREVSELAGAVVGCLAYGDTVLAERFVAGVEVAVTVLDEPGGPRALPAVEIEATSGFYDFEARYTAGLATFYAPARLDTAATAAAAELALNAHRVLGLRDISRTDMMVTPDGIAHFLEVNVAPGLTETSLLPMAVESTGAHLGTVYATLIDQAISRAQP